MRLIRAKGSSMSPAINNGDIMLVIRPRTLRAGLVYIVNHPDLGRIVKRLEHIKDGQYYFIGDDKSSTPKALIMPVTKERIIGRVIFSAGKYGLSVQNLL